MKTTATTGTQTKPKPNKGVKIFKKLYRVPLSIYGKAEELEFVPIKGLGICLPEALVEEDATIYIGGRVFKCYSSLLIEHFNYFAKHLKCGGSLKLRSGITAELFQWSYGWLFLDQVHKNRANLLELLDCARFFGIDKLSASIWDCLANQEYYNEMDAFECFVEARRRNLKQVANLMLTRIHKCFLTLVGTREFAELSYIDVETLLASNHIGVQSEMEVLYAAMLWIYYDPCYRLTFLPQLLSVVRFELLPTSLLLELKNTHKYIPNQVMLQRVLRSLVFGQEVQLSLDRFHYIMEERAWIKDKQCPYLGNLKECKLLSAKDYVSYIKILQCEGWFQWKQIVSVTMGIGLVEDDDYEDDESQFDNFVQSKTQMRAKQGAGDCTDDVYYDTD